MAHRCRRFDVRVHTATNSHHHTNEEVITFDLAYRRYASILPPTRMIISSLVATDEVGQGLGLIGIVESFSATFCGLGWGYVYAETVSWYPPFVFLCLAAAAFGSFVLSVRMGHVPTQCAGSAPGESLLPQSSDVQSSSVQSSDVQSSSDQSRDVQRSTPGESLLP